MPKQAKPDKYVPKHRAARPASFSAEAPRRALRTTAVLSGVAVAATGVAVSGGVVTSQTSPTAAAGPLDLGAGAASAADELTAQQLAERAASTVSRSDRRTEVDPSKAAALSASDGPAVTRQEDLSDADPRDIARALLPEFGFDASQFSCLDSLYVSESDWRVDADNPTSSAYGIPQALTQLHDLPADYMTSAEAQIRWGLDYIRDAYGTPCSAWSFKQGHNWY